MIPIVKQTFIDPSICLQVLAMIFVFLFLVLFVSTIRESTKEIVRDLETQKTELETAWLRQL